ncbi:5-(carboxyamino)imidazole ribonucleotide mutase [bacterium]|jgi:5-(carboxyamino)imidazole ribonucleotide mutase|nr:5-(carboxyamino)imidazole ribonucleotide mutase [bacterium]
MRKSAANALVAIAMGSDSDWRIMEQAHTTLREFGVKTLVRVVSAHRTPEDLGPFMEECENKGIAVVIAGAGGAAHLPGMLASHTVLPVIGVPVNITALEGLDAFLSIVQMPAGIPVAAVAIDNSKNAALLALRILATSDAALRKKLKDHKLSMARESRKKNGKIRIS